MNIYDQLQAVEDRYEELGELLSDPEVVSDTKRFMELSREEANTRETVTAYREYKQVIQSISDAEEMIKAVILTWKKWLRKNSKNPKLLKKSTKNA